MTATGTSNKCVKYSLLQAAGWEFEYYFTCSSTNVGAIYTYDPGAEYVPRVTNENIQFQAEQYATIQVEWYPPQTNITLNLWMNCYCSTSSVYGYKTVGSGTNGSIGCSTGYGRAISVTPYRSSWTAQVQMPVCNNQITSTTQSGLFLFYIDFMIEVG